MNAHVFILCGLAFAGKTTLARAIEVETGARVISLDELNRERGLFGGRGIEDHEWVRSHQLALERLDETLSANRAAVVDDTNCFRFLRDDYRAVAARHRCGSTVLWLDVDLATVRARIDANRVAPRREHIAPDVLIDLAAKFEDPASDEQVIRVPAGADMSMWVREQLDRGRFR